MSGFTPLEDAALRAIFQETPELAEKLLAQFADASVADRENTGGGFFTTISVPSTSSPIESPRVLAHETYARVVGLEYGLGFVLFMKDGQLHLLEGYSCGGEDTRNLPLFDLIFQIANAPFDG